MTIIPTGTTSTVLLLLSHFCNGQ